MKEISSIGKMTGIIGSGVPCGTNSEKKCRPCFQKPTISTIEKLMMASTPVAVKWLVKVKGCSPNRPSGSRPKRFASRMNMKSEKT